MRAVSIRPLRYITAFKKATSPKKVLAIGSAALSGLAIARVLVLLLESYVTVRDERAADAELVQLCAQGQARFSADFRSLCLKKNSELAAPIVFKAVLRACSTAFTDFSELFSSPGRVAMLVLFGLTGVTAPVAKAFVKILMTNLKLKRRPSRSKYATSDDSDSESDDGKFRVIEMGAVPSLTRSSSRRRLGTTVRRSIRRLTMASHPNIEELDDDM